MPKLGMEPIRRDAVIEAAIAEIGAAGSLEVTVSQIAKRAGMSSALAHHYFGGKEQIFLAAMRHILREFGREVRSRLAKAECPRSRVEAVIAASFTTQNFAPDVVSAWLNFYVQAQTNPAAMRLLRVYHHRLRANLVHDLRPLCGPRARDAADGIAAMIDGLYIRASLGAVTSAQEAAGTLFDYLDLQLGQKK